MENLVNAKVVYKDIKNNNRIVQTKNVSGQENIPISLNYYKQHTPSNYQFSSFGHFDHQLKDGDVNVIYVIAHNDASSTKNGMSKGTIMVDYINANNQLVGHKKLSGYVNSSFDRNQCKTSLPDHYQFKRILTGQNIHTFKSSPQIMMVQVEKIKSAKIVVRYLCNNKFIGNLKTHVAIGKPVDMHRYISMVPTGYKFVRVDGMDPKIVKSDQIINVEVVPKVSKQSQSGRDRDSDQNNGQYNKGTKGTKTGNSNEDPKKIGAILMKLASSLHDLGLSISKNNKL